MKTPVNQKRLTNIAVVRYKKNGQRFEIACYPNTVEAWRENIETNLDEVLQSRVIFSNVSKGQAAKSELVAKAFGDEATEEAIMKEILTKGELQLGEKEREAALVKIRKEIATMLAAMSVNPSTMRPYPVTLIEKAMKDVHFKAEPREPAKKQAIELLGILEKKMPIQRAKMRLHIHCSVAVEQTLQTLVSNVESRIEGEAGMLDLVVLIKPGNFRQVEEAAKATGNATVTVASLAATKVGEGTIEEVTEGAGKMRLAESERRKEAEEAKDAGDEANDNNASSDATTTTNGRKGKKKKAGNDNAAAANGQDEEFEDQQQQEASKAALSKRAQRGQPNMNDLMGIVEDDSDEDWKNKGKGKGKGGKGKKKK